MVGWGWTRRASADTSYGDWERYCVKKTLCQYLRGRAFGFDEVRDGGSCVGRGMFRCYSASRVVQTRAFVSSYQEMGKSRVRHMLIYSSQSIHVVINYRYIV